MNVRWHLTKQLYGNSYGILVNPNSSLNCSSQTIFNSTCSYLRLGVRVALEISQKRHNLKCSKNDIPHNLPSAYYDMTVRSCWPWTSPCKGSKRSLTDCCSMELDISKITALHVQSSINVKLPDIQDYACSSDITCAIINKCQGSRLPWLFMFFRLYLSPDNY